MQLPLSSSIPVRNRRGSSAAQLVEVRGISKRQKKPVDLTIEHCFMLIDLLPEPYRTMVITALFTGLRIEEILALDWTKIDFLRLCNESGGGGGAWSPRSSEDRVF